jgi:hypothetical protein
MGGIEGSGRDDALFPGARTFESELRARRERGREQAVQIPNQEMAGKKCYVVEVDMKGNPCGQNRAMWLACL